MGARNLRDKPATGAGLFSRARLAGLIAALLCALGLWLGWQNPRADAGTNPSGSAAEATQSQREFQLLLRKCYTGTPAEKAAARTELSTWVEQLEASVLASTQRDERDFGCIFDAACALADLDVASRETWYSRAERAMQAMPVGERRRYCNSSLHVSRAQDCLNRNEDTRARRWIDRALAENLAADVEPFALLAKAELVRREGEKQLALDLLKRVDALLSNRPAFPNPALVCSMLERQRAQTYIDLGLPDLAWRALLLCKAAAKEANSQEDLYAAVLIEVNLYLGSDRAQEVIQRLRPDGVMKPLPAPLQLRLGIALADSERLEPGSSADAETVLEGVLEDSGLPAEERRIAQLALVELHLRQGNWSMAQQHLEFARAELGRLLSAQSTGARPREEAEIEAMATRLMLTRRDTHSSPEGAALQLEALRGAFTRFVEQLRHIEPRPGGVGFLHFSSRRFILNELIEMSIAVEGEQRGFELAMEALVQVQELGSLSRVLGKQISEQLRPGDPGQTSNAGALASISVAEVRERLTQQDGGVLVFLPDFHRTMVLAFDKRSTGLCEVAAPAGQWRDAVRDFSNALATPPAGLTKEAAGKQLAGIDTLGKQVAALLLTPALRARIADWKSITIVGIDMLDDLPFEGLPWDGKQTFGMRWAIDRAPSLPAAVLLARRQALQASPDPASAGLWLVAAPQMPEWADQRLQDLATIPFDDANRAALQRPYAKLDKSCFLGPGATRAALQDPRLKLARVLQLSCHGIEVLGNERPAAIALCPQSRDDDGLLDCEDVERLHVPGTVVLSVCSSARGERRLGEDGLNNLGGAFLKAGASCVVLASRAVEAQAMQALMEVFHQRLASGDTRAESMRAARAALALNPRFSHPFYHSLVAVVGLGQTGG